MVVSIIGLLMALAVPRLSQSRAQAKAAVCLSNLHGLGRAFSVYAAENRDYLCSGQADARPGMNLPASVTDLAATGLERIGWIADLVNSGAAYPGRMLCPSNPGRLTQSWDRALSLPGGTSRYPPEVFRRLTRDAGYNTNYCQSWYMIHTEYDGVTRPVTDSDLMYGSVGPLRSALMSKAGAARVPLLGDARAPKDAVFDHSAQGYGSEVRETKSATDGPGWAEQPDGSYVAVAYSSSSPYGIQDFDDFGPAHRPKHNLRNDEQHSFTSGNLLFGDGHAATIDDRFDLDNGRLKLRPDGELDSWDLRYKVFDGVITLGRRSTTVTRVQ